MGYRRRTTLGSIAAVATAGCLSSIRTTPTADPGRYRLRFVNSDSVTHNVHVEIRRRDDGEVVFDQVRAVGNDDDALDLSEHLDPSLTYELTVSMDDETVAGVHLLPDRSVTVDILSADAVEVRVRADDG